MNPNIVVLKRQLRDDLSNCEYAAIFSERIDIGEWEFQLCASIGLLSPDALDNVQAGIPIIADVLTNLVESMSDGEFAGDRMLVVFSGEPDFPCVYEATDDKVQSL
jgi:hypothetical protein